MFFVLTTNIHIKSKKALHDISNDDILQYKFKHFLTQNLPSTPQQ
jgi:hypothetical protein